MLVTVVPVATAADTNWNVSTLAGNSSLVKGYADGNGINAKFYGPYGVTVIGGDTVIVADFGMGYIIYTKYMMRACIYGLECALNIEVRFILEPSTRYGGEVYLRAKY